MNTKEVTILFWDNLDNFQMRDTQIGLGLRNGQSLKYKNVFQFNNVSEFDKIINELNDEELILILVHVDRGNSDIGAKEFKLVIEDGRFLPEEKRKLISKGGGTGVYDYDGISNAIQTDRITPYRKKQLFSNSDDSIKIEKTKYPYFEYAIITALYKDEFENLVRVFELKKDESNLLDDWSYYLGSINTKKIIAVYQNNSGAEDASSLATKLISKFSPRYIFMPGVCGAPELAFGSIVISKFVFNINKGKIKDNTFFKELEVCKTNDILINKLSSALSNSVSKLQSILISNPTYKKMYRGFDFQSIVAVIEPTACSSSVVSDENYFNNVISNIDRKTAAVEMEGYGIMRAAELTNNGNTKAIIIKGVMDHADGNKNDDAKEFAALTSALFLKNLLEDNVLG